MLYRTNEKVKTVCAKTAETFDDQMELVLNDLIRKGIKYTLEFAPQQVFTCYIRYEVPYKVPENTADKFELGGEIHKCVECPNFIPPTDGRVKYGGCKTSDAIVRRTDRCCNEFYERLLRGEIELVEVFNGKDEEGKKV